MRKEAVSGAESANVGAPQHLRGSNVGGPTWDSLLGSVHTQRAQHSTTDPMTIDEQALLKIHPYPFPPALLIHLTTIYI